MVPTAPPPVKRKGRAVSSILYEDGLADAVAHKPLHPGLLEALLALFDGGDVPALYNYRGWPRGWHPAWRVSKATAFRAHLLGQATAAAYPFRGVLPGCGCPPKAHTCDGRGARYLDLDVDAHNGESDAGDLTTRTIVACLAAGLTPTTFVSRSGTGSHIFVFVDEAVPTRVLAAAGAAIRAAAGAQGRCDVIPSAEHAKGLGTCHALPLSPVDFEERGGGILLDKNLRAVIDPTAVVEALRTADRRRNASILVYGLAADPSRALTPKQRRPPAADIAPPTGAPRRLQAQREPHGAPAARSRGADALLVATVAQDHPQWRADAASDPAEWSGKRSARDAQLARYLARAGVSPEGIAAALPKVRGSKAATRGKGYSAAIAAWSPDEPHPLPLLPGMPVPRSARSFCTGGNSHVQSAQEPGDVSVVVHDDRGEVHHDGAGPWRGRRVPPPRWYEAAPGVREENPWWRADVQARLGATKARADGPVLAFLIAHWVWGRGVHARRPYFLGLRAIGAALGYSTPTVRASVARLARDYQDVLHIVAGKPHPLLRLANRFDVPGLSTNAPQPRGGVDTTTSPEYVVPQAPAPHDGCDGVDGPEAARVADGDARDGSREREPGRPAQDASHPGLADALAPWVWDGPGWPGGVLRGGAGVAPHPQGGAVHAPGGPRDAGPWDGDELRAPF